MKYVVGIVMLLISLTSAHGQSVAMENVKNDYAYPYVTCPLIITAEKVPCSRVIAKTNNGVIRKGEDCQFEYTPSEVGSATIFIYKTGNSDTFLLSKKEYRIKSWPQQYARIGSKQSGPMKSDVFKAQFGIKVQIESFDIDGILPISSFRIRMIRSGDVFFDIENEGSRFNEQVDAEIRKIQSGDELIFTEIYARMPGEKKHRAE